MLHTFLQISSNTKWKRTNASSQLKEAISKQKNNTGSSDLDQINQKKEFLVFIPDEKAHAGHVLGEVRLFVII